MMLSAIGREFSRQLSEYKQFKVNLLFANMGIFFLVTGFLTYFDSQKDTFELFILLFTWYFSSHSITHPTYFIEDEIADRTIINVIQSRRSIFVMLFIKIIVQILLDLVKAIPLFCLVVFDLLDCSAFDSSGFTNSLFFEGHQFPRTARGTDWFPDFPRLLSCHDSTDYPLPTNFSLGRFSKHRALILLRTRLSSGEFWEFEEII